MSARKSDYRSMYSINRKGKRTFAGGGGEFQSKTSRGVGKRRPDMPSPPKPREG